MKTVPAALLALNLVATVLSVVTAGSLQAQSWLPSEFAEILARQLAGRMKQAGLGPLEDEQKLLAGARRMVAALEKEIEVRGEKGIVELAPRFSDLELPQSGQRELDLMASYNICNLLLFRQLEDPAFRDDINAQITSTLGLTGMAMVIIFLREPFVAAGNDVSQIEAHLTDPALQPIFDRIQEDLELRASVETTCQPVVTALLEKPLSDLGEQ